MRLASPGSLQSSVRSILGALVWEERLAPCDLARSAGALADHVPALPWYARALTGCFGWLAALCLFAWSTRFELGPRLQVIAGIAAMVAGVVVARFWRRGYLAYLAIAVTLAGEVLAAGGVHTLCDNQTAASLFVLGAEVVLLLAYRDSMIRGLSALAAAGALGNLWWLHGLSHQVGERWNVVHDYDLPLLASLAAALVLLNARPRLARTWARDLVSPLAYGLALSACGVVLLALETRWTDVELGLPARIGAGALLVGQIALITVETRARWWVLPLAALGAIALVAGSVGSPGVLVALALLACAWHRREPGLVSLAAVFLALFYLWLYGSLEQTLLFKAQLLLANGALFVGLWWALRPRRRAAQAEPASRVDRWLAGFAVLLALLIVNTLVIRKEGILDRGELVLLELRPTDPRSLLQGDYMTLRYRLTDDLEPRRREGRLVVALGADRVAELRRVDDGSPLRPGERPLRYRRRDGGLRIGAEAYFFPEGDAARYAQARYGALRVTSRGDSVLVGLRDRAGQPLGPELVARR